MSNELPKSWRDVTTYKNEELNCKHEYKFLEIEYGYSIWKCRCGKLQKRNKSEAPSPVSE